MKSNLTYLLLLSSMTLFSQVTEKEISVSDFIKNTGIKLNTPTPPHGFKVYYNCSDDFFMRGDFGDTIKIWTPGSSVAEDLSMFKETIKNERFGITLIAKRIQLSGRVLVVSYWDAQFIFRHDSLFKIENSNPIPPEAYGNIFSDFIQDKISEDSFHHILDSLHAIPEYKPINTPKLIFTKTMFKRRNKVKLPKTVNFDGDTVILEKVWIENKIKCYQIQIKSKDKFGENQRSYSYSFDENLRFVLWEKCNSQ